VSDTHDETVTFDWLKEYGHNNQRGNRCYFPSIFNFHFGSQNKIFIIFQALYCKSATTGRGCVKAMNDKSIQYVYEALGSFICMS
jgi:hypothetical protein